MTPSQLLALRNSRTTWAGCLVLLLSSVAVGQEERFLGPCELVASRDASILYVACTDASQVAWVQLPGGKVLRRIDVPAEPTGLVLSPNGTRLFVTCAAPKSTVLVIDADSGEVASTISVGHTAMAPTLSPNGSRLYVCNRFDNDVSMIDLTTGLEVERLAVVREPVAAAITSDGKFLLVANHLPNSRADVDYTEEVAAGVSVIDTRSGQSITIQLPHGSASLRDICLSPDAKHAYVTHILSSFERVPAQLDMGWTNMNVISVLDTRAGKVINTVGLDDLFLGAGNPWGAACTADGKSILVCHAGSNELSVVDASTVLGQLDQTYVSPRVGATPYRPPTEPQPRRRIQLPGRGPRGIAVVGHEAYIAQYFSDSLAVVDLQSADETSIRTIALGPKPRLTVRRRGEMLFNDATICYQQWQSCASCHPDGRADALNWDLMNDGLGNFKNTKSMLLAHQTPPAMAEAVRPSAEVAVRSGLAHILFANRPEAEAAAIDVYLKALRPTPSPYLVDGQLSPSARRGEVLFHDSRVGCFRCHPAPLYTDRKKHDVGTRSMFEFSERFDTPTLVEVWRTAPYLHHGRYTTIKSLFVEGKHGKSRGAIEELDEQDLDDLVEFVLSL